VESEIVTSEKLVGTWKLVAASSVTSNGDRNETPYGQNPVGFLSYAPDARVTAIISYGGRKPLAIGASAEEQAEAFRTFLAYAGRYTFSADKITHRIEVSSIQSYVNKDLVRSVRFNGDRMTLVTPPTVVNGKVQTIELIWERLPVGS
jgi:Lipocalin-like domain